MNAKTYKVIITGCQMNKSDSERISAYLAKLRYQEARDEFEADFVVLTTCGIRESAERKIYNLIEKLKKEKTKTKIILTGCLSKRSDVQEILKDKVDLWLPIIELASLGKKLEAIGIKSPQKEEFGSLKNYLAMRPKYLSNFSAFIPIGNGCDNFCSYCVVPYARGREVYRDVGEILEEVEKLVKKGYKEITLIAQNVNSYYSIFNKQSSFNGDTSDRTIYFPQLLKLVNDIPGDFWLRFASSHPKDMSDELIDIFKDCAKLCEYIHLPVQSGDDQVLKRMNRRYAAKHYLGLINKIRKSFEEKNKNNSRNDVFLPPVSITTDIIVGFPGETQAQFQNTLDLAKKAKFNMAYIGRFSPRPGTAAFHLEDNISKEEKREREALLMRVIRAASLADNQKYLNKQVEVLIEGKNRKGLWHGKTRTFKNVKLKNSDKLKNKDFKGKLVKVKIKEAEDLGMTGSIISQ